MSINLTRLAPAPWKQSQVSVPEFVDDAHNNPLLDCSCGDEDVDAANAAFIALARNAFDVMVRRGWGVVLMDDNKWMVHGIMGMYSDSRRALGLFPDPFTALVEADRWYAENIESKKQAT